MKTPRTRVVLLWLTLLVAVQVTLAIVAYVKLLRDPQQGFQLPLPARIAAMVASVEALRPDARSDLLRALQSEDVDVWLTTEATPPVADHPRALVRPAQRLVDRYVEALGQREVRAWLAPRSGETFDAPRFEAMRLWSRHPLRLAVSLRDGGWMIVESRGNHAYSILGTPPGFWSGLLGIAVAALALLSLWRGLKPLEALTRSVERFAQRPEPAPIQPSGPEETRRIIDAVNRMQRDLADLIAERKVMFGALSHDLRTYLTRLKLRIDLMEDPDARDRAQRDVDAMAEIIEDALLFAKLDGATPPDQTIEVGGLLAELRRTLNLGAAELSVDTRAEAAQVRGDPLELVRAVQNLAENANDYGQGRQIAVAVEDGVMILDVLDRGPGIPEAERARLLQPFERGNTARSQQVPGTGLGLAIAARAATRCGGALYLLDRPGGGLIARLRLPLVPPTRDSLSLTMAPRSGLR